ncbi:hypothetical protein [Roseimaritima sediminicola]|uniref:hypothetical protein n=1 Tax=Roseimaritima sediminicola TaxID=2662066 RepID=UPI001F3D4A8E|nr:hypothetical protein [Roseimaritima sediminicola]
MIDPRRFDEIVAVTADIRPAQVVDKNQHDVGLVTVVGCSRLGSAKKDESRHENDEQTANSFF